MQVRKQQLKLDMEQQTGSKSGKEYVKAVYYHQLLELAQAHAHQVGDASNHLILCHPLLLLSSIFPSIKVFPSESVLPIR